MTEIRPIKLEDFDDVIELLKEFHADVLNEFVGFDITVVKDSITKHFDTTLVLEIEGKVVGIIAGQEIDYPLQKAKLFQEIIWYVSKKHRRHGIALLHEVERRCKERGNSGIIMVHLYNNKEKMERFYEFMGYKLMEIHYFKRLT